MTQASPASQWKARPALMAWVRRHPALALAGLACLFQVSVLALPAAGARGLLPVGWGLPVSALIITGVAGGRAGLQDLLRRYLIWKLGAGWAAMVLCAGALRGRRLAVIGSGV